MTSVSSRPIHCLSFDVEEHFQVSAFDSTNRRQQWDWLESRVAKNTNRILELLDRKNVRATFFILGWVAERHPDVVRAIVRAGHEIASHGYAHELVSRQDPETFRRDVKRTKQILEDLTGAPVRGYRAPSFSIHKETMWALKVLVEEGYTYDSSIFPILHDRYGLVGAQWLPHEIATGAGKIWEVPPSTIGTSSVRLPVAGGGYFRLVPYRILYPFLKRIESKGDALVMYFHPWELDPEQPRMEGPWLSKFRHYLNLRQTEGRLAQLMNDFQFGPIAESVASLNA